MIVDRNRSELVECLRVGLVVMRHLATCVRVHQPLLPAVHVFEWAESSKNTDQKIRCNHPGTRLHRVVVVFPLCSVTTSLSIGVALVTINFTAVGFEFFTKLGLANAYATLCLGLRLTRFVPFFARVFPAAIALI
jgi:hypothetical protein